MAPVSMAMSATGSRKLIGPALILTAAMFPFVLFTPLLTTKILFLTYNEIILARVAYDLFYVDKFLFVIVFIFGIVIPACKMIISILCWYQFPASKAELWTERLVVLSKLSMLDIMLLAIFIIAFKGIGIGVVQIQYGLYIYVSLIVCSLGLNLAVTNINQGRQSITSKRHNSK